MSAKSLPIRMLVACLAAGSFSQSGAANESHISVTVDAARTYAPISPYLYGQFIEHIGDLVNRSVWADPPPPPMPGPPRGRRPNRWRPIGPDSAIVMDRRNPYVGEHLPLIRLAGAEPRGIQQAVLALRKSRSYPGLIRHEVQVAESPANEVPKVLDVPPTSIHVYEWEKR